MSIKREEYESIFLRFAYALGFNCAPLFYPYKPSTFKFLKINDIFGFNWGYPDWIECIDTSKNKLHGVPIWRLGTYSQESEKTKIECIKKLKNSKPVDFLNWYMPGYNIDYENKYSQIKLTKLKQDKLVNDLDQHVSLFDISRNYKKIKNYYKIIKSHNDYLFKKDCVLDLNKYVMTTMNNYAPVIRIKCKFDFDNKLPKRLLTLINSTLHTNYDKSIYLYTEQTLEGDSVVYLYLDQLYNYESKTLFCKAIKDRLQLDIETSFGKECYRMLPLSNRAFGERSKQTRIDIMEPVIAKAMRISKDPKKALLDGYVFQLDKFMQELPKNGMLNIPKVINQNKGFFVETMKDVASVAEYCRSRNWVVRTGARSINQVRIVTAGVIRGFNEGQCRELLDLLWEGSEDFPGGLPSSVFGQLYSYCVSRNSRSQVQHTTSYSDIFTCESTYGDKFLREFRYTNKYKSHFIPDIIKILNEKSEKLGKHHVINCMLRKNSKQVHKLFKAINSQLIENVFYNVHNPRKNDFIAKDYGNLNRRIYFSFTIFKKVCLSLDFMQDYKDPTLKQFYYVVKDVLMKYYNLLPIKLTEKHTYIATKICEQYTSEIMDDDVFTLKYIEQCNKLGSKDTKRLMRRFKQWLSYNNIKPDSKEVIDILFESFITECKKPGNEFCIDEILDILKAHKMGGVRNKEKYYETAKRRLQLNRLINSSS